MFIISAMSCADETNAEVAESTLPREHPADISDSDIDQAVRGNTEFAFDLYGIIRDDERQEEKNIFISPYSVSMALAMTYAGARGETETQMANTLHFTLPQENLHPALNNLDIELMSRSEGVDGNLVINISNSIWGQTGYIFLQDFLDLLASSYGTGLRLCDFLSDPDGSRETINTWVEDRTMERIQDLIPPEAITPLTTLVLVNAIYFKGDWLYPFDESRTTSMPFKLLDGSEINVQTMRDTHEIRYMEHDWFQAIELPYVGEKLSMLVILPKEGTFMAFENSLDNELLVDVAEGLGSPTNVFVLLPRFSFEFGTSLADYLRSLGMPAAFGNADFSGMDGTRSLFISEVLHKAFIAVDEIGSEAAAATAVIMERGSVMTPTFMANRPFIFLIRDNETGSVLFLGRVLNPGN